MALKRKKTRFPNQDEKKQRFRMAFNLNKQSWIMASPVLDRFVFHKLSCRWPYSVLLDVYSKKPAYFPQWFLHEWVLRGRSTSGEDVPSLSGWTWVLMIRRKAEILGITWLVGGFNHLTWLVGRVENKKYLKPPPSWMICIDFVLILHWFVKFADWRNKIRGWLPQKMATLISCY